MLTRVPRLSISRPSALLFALALGFAPSCKIAEAHAHNLDQLHEDTGRHKRQASLVSGSDYALQQMVASLMRRKTFELRGDAPKKVKDPLSVCVENLIELSQFEPETENASALQVEYFARYAVQDPWQISRQICVRALGVAGLRLNLAEHPPQAMSGEIATPEAVRNALTPMIHATTLSARGGEASTGLAAACQAMAALNYDLDGLLRALPASSYLLRREPLGSKNRELLLALVVDLERRTVQQALDRASTDSNSYVRAAAIEALVSARGREYLARSFPQLGTEIEPEVPLALLGMVRSIGLPGSTSVTADPAQTEREGELALLYQVATQHPVERVRISAMSTLSEVSGAGFRSLREEDWQTWWFARTQPVAR